MRKAFKNTLQIFFCFLFVALGLRDEASATENNKTPWSLGTKSFNFTPPDPSEILPNPPDTSGSARPFMKSYGPSEGPVPEAAETDFRHGPDGRDTSDEDRRFQPGSRVVRGSGADPQALGRAIDGLGLDAVGVADDEGELPETDTADGGTSPGMNDGRATGERLANRRQRLAEAVDDLRLGTEEAESRPGSGSAPSDDVSAGGGAGSDRPRLAGAVDGLDLGRTGNAGGEVGSDELAGNGPSPAEGAVGPGEEAEDEAGRAGNGEEVADSGTGVGAVGDRQGEVGDNTEPVDGDRLGGHRQRLSDAISSAFGRVDQGPDTADEASTEIATGPSGGGATTGQSSPNRNNATAGNGSNTGIDGNGAREARMTSGQRQGELGQAPQSSQPGRSGGGSGGDVAGAQPADDGASGTGSGNANQRVAGQGGNTGMRPQASQSTSSPIGRATPGGVGTGSDQTETAAAEVSDGAGGGNLSMRHDEAGNASGSGTGNARGNDQAASTVPSGTMGQLPSGARAQPSPGSAASASGNNNGQKTGQGGIGARSYQPGAPVGTGPVLQGGGEATASQSGVPPMPRAVKPGSERPGSASPGGQTDGGETDQSTGSQNAGVNNGSSPGGAGSSQVGRQVGSQTGGQAVGNGGTPSGSGNRNSNTGGSRVVVAPDTRTPLGAGFQGSSTEGNGNEGDGTTDVASAGGSAPVEGGGVDGTPSSEFDGNAVGQGGGPESPSYGGPRARSPSAGTTAESGGDTINAGGADIAGQNGLSGSDTSSTGAGTNSSSEIGATGTGSGSQSTAANSDGGSSVGVAAAGEGSAGSELSSGGEGGDPASSLSPSGGAGQQAPMAATSPPDGLGSLMASLSQSTDMNGMPDAAPMEVEAQPDLNGELPSFDSDEDSSMPSPDPETVEPMAEEGGETTDASLSSEATGDGSAEPETADSELPAGGEQPAEPEALVEHNGFPDEIPASVPESESALNGDIPSYEELPEQSAGGRDLEAVSGDPDAFQQGMAGDTQSGETEDEITQEEVPASEGEQLAEAPEAVPGETPTARGQTAESEPASGAGDTEGRPITGEPADVLTENVAPEPQPESQTQPEPAATPAPDAPAAEQPSDTASEPATPSETEQAQPARPIGFSEFRAEADRIGNVQRAMADMDAVASGQLSADTLPADRAEDLRRLTDLERRTGGIDNYLKNIERTMTEAVEFTHQAEQESRTLGAQAAALSATMGVITASELLIKVQAFIGNPMAISINRGFEAAKEVGTGVGEMIASDPGDTTAAGNGPASSEMAAGGGSNSASGNGSGAQQNVSVAASSGGGGAESGSVGEFGQATADTVSAATELPGTRRSMDRMERLQRYDTEAESAAIEAKDEADPSRRRLGNVGQIASSASSGMEAYGEMRDAMEAGDNDEAAKQAFNAIKHGGNLVENAGELMSNSSGRFKGVGDALSGAGKEVKIGAAIDSSVMSLKQGLSHYQNGNRTEVGRSIGEVIFNAGDVLDNDRLRDAGEGVQEIADARQRIDSSGRPIDTIIYSLQATQGGLKVISQLPATFQTREQGEILSQTFGTLARTLIYGRDTYDFAQQATRRSLVDSNPIISKVITDSVRYQGIFRRDNGQGLRRR